MAAYPFTEIEPRWQTYWEEHKTFRTSDVTAASDPSDKPKFYALDMFPYPSGAGLHVGHPEGYTATDIVTRYKRMKGFNVLHPMGWDAFGLPAEQYAIETGTHPRETTYRNIARFRAQLKSLGFSYDWEREVATTDPEYYRWTQWIFLKLFARGLAYQAEVPVNWCPALGTVLANEEVIDGKSERGGHPVIRKPMLQWMLKITEYAERLLADLDDLDWSESIKEMQRNWIGRSEGAEVEFRISNFESRISVFTTRPDTLFGATYMVLAPEHPLVGEITAPAQRAAVQAYREAAARKSELERTELQKVKTGVATGAFAINPVNGEAIPIWVADYVLWGYGTGAIMAVPAHDERDFAFAKTFGLPIVEVVSAGGTNPAGETRLPFVGEGVAVHSGLITGLPTAEAKKRITAWLAEKGFGSAKVNYKLRDWLFSRQRYWGEPFPLVHCAQCGVVPVPDQDLPVTLPELSDFRPTGEAEPPLARAADWVNCRCPKCGGAARRETNTMPQWAGSCWYYLRFIDPGNTDAFLEGKKEQYWMPVDLYVGGAEHAVLHLLYARFWHKVLYDCGLVSTKEPFRKLVNQGMILGEVEYTLYRDANGQPVSFTDEALAGKELTAERLADDAVEKKGESFVWKEQPAIRIEARTYKMSKSRGNVINPDDVVTHYGADSLRLYEMFMGPLEQVKPWSMRGVEGVHRFLNRVWRLVVEEETGALRDAVSDSSDASDLSDKQRLLHKTIKKVTEDLDGMRFNTALSSMMEFVNEATKWSTLPRAILEPFLLILSPFAPHLAEELWSRLGHPASLAHESWPAFDASLLVSETVEMVVQVNGKLRGKVVVASGAGQAEVLAAARAVPSVLPHLAGKTVRKEVYVPGKLVNLVVG